MLHCQVSGVLLLARSRTAALEIGQLFADKSATAIANEIVKSEEKKIVTRRKHWTDKFSGSATEEAAVPAHTFSTENSAMEKIYCGIVVGRSFNTSGEVLVEKSTGERIVMGEKENLYKLEDEGRWEENY